jgi:RHS repeat-associated protein
MRMTTRRHVHRWTRARAPVALLSLASFLLAQVPLYARAEAITHAVQNEHLDASEAPQLNAAREALRDVAQAPDPNAPSSPPPATPLSLPFGGERNGVSNQTIHLPQGGGKVEGMGESFSMQLSTGVATYSIPFRLPSARGGAQPQLALSFSSAAGPGVAGLGWALSVPFIARQTDRGVPKYKDDPFGGGWHPEQDRFVFNGGQELVPICQVKGGACAGAQSGEVMPAWASGWQYFRPRVEGAFLRFFWSPDRTEWRVQGKAGDTMILGGDAGAREADPNHPGRIFSWRLSRHHDARTDAQGRPVNVVVYRYLQDGGVLYLSDVYDTPPADSAATAPLSSYAHHTRLIYQPRADVISSYRRGWETKSALRLSSVDVTSKTDSAGAPRELVRRYHLAYEDILSSKPVYTSLLAHVWMEGRCAQPIAENSNEELPRWTTCPTLPPMTFEYLHVEGYAPDGRPTAAPDDGFEPFDARLKAMANSPQHAVHHTDTGLFDMDADGLPDVLVTDPAGHRVFFNGPQGQRDTFGGAQALGIQPVLGESAQSLLLKDWNVAPLDLDGDGTIDLVRMPPGVGTYSVYTAAPGAWKGRAVALPPGQLGILKFGSDAPRLRSMDVDGDGLVDLVFINGHEVQTFFALGRYPGGDGKFGHATWTGPDTASLSTEPVHACLPYITAGAPVRFDDPNWPIEIADMNGDGLPDLVYVYKGWIRYWPGRGNGHFGTETNPPATGACGTEGAIRMPELAQHTKNPVRLDDVSGDGLDDLVEFGETSSGGIVSVWLNKGGASWTPVRAIVGTPSRAPGLDYGANVRLVDIDGSGTRDILWGDGLRYRYLDLLGGRRPRLLTKIHNGLGKTTELEYASSTELMLAAEASGKPWATKMPIAAHVVTRVTERDNLEKIGRPAGVYTTEYSYRDPIYEGRQREFRGFREVTAKRLGDANSPTSLASSTFLLGECKEDCGPESRWKDNPREVLKGLPVVTESFDEQGTYLSTTHHKYRLRRLYLGLDGRDVWHAFAREEDTWAYDTAPFVASASSLTITDVEIEDDPKALWTGASLRPDLDRTLALRSSAGRVRLQSRVAVDPWGNTREKTAEGCIEGCPARDEQITSYAAPNLVPEPGGWMWRTGTSFVMGTASSTQRNLTSFTYDSAGAPVFVTKTIEGGLPLDRFHEDPTKAIAPTPASAILNGVAVTQLVYDTFGNLRFERGRDARCRAVTFDQAFADLPVTETIYAGTAQDGCGTTLLTTLASFDRGLEAITSAHGVNGELTLASYDAFGRVTAISKPSAASVGMIATRPSVRIDYDLPTAARPFTRVHVQTHDGQADTDDSYRHAYSSIDGLGRTIVAIEQADLSAGDGGQWIVRGLGDYDAKGAPKRQHLAWFWSGDPLAFPLASSAPTAFARARFDAFGRTVQAFGLDGAITLETRYHALSEEAWDAADLAPGPHQGTYASVRKDGHGRTVETTERVRVSGALEERHVTTSYLPTGEPTMITRRRGSDTYVRWMRRDSLGRIVLNVEPSTTKGFSADPSTAPTAMKAWRYAYNASGDLVGTSDARGCGQNFHYEAAGRLLAEDYSPCLASHADYTPPNLVTGEGTEVFLRYDSVDPDWTSVIMADPAFGTFPTLYMGRLASVSDRGQKTLTRYDARGRATGIAKKVAKPEAPAASPAQRYAPRWYTQTATFDEADRPFAETTGAQVQELLGAGGQSSVSIEYSKRDTVKKVTSSYGELIGSIVREADGPIAKIIYGDLAKTTTEMSFDLRRRLSSVQTYRGPPSLWSSPTYVPAIDGTTTQLLLEDTDFKYDLVDNPVEIQDHRLASEWPSGAKPASRKIHYDDVYRVTKVEHLYAASDDTWVSPFTSENAGAIDPRRAKPSPHVAFAKRVLSQTFEYDWLGNTTRTTDDAAGFYDRSLGAIANAGYQLRAATGLTSSRDGSLTAAYDDAGYLTSLAVLRNGGCIPAGSVCSQRFAYEWDEVGRLVRARRWDIAAPGSATDPLPQGAPAAELRHVYDGADQRVVKTATDAQGSAVHTVYVFESLELRRARWDGTEFERTAWTEVPYLFAHGVRLARVHWAENDVPNAQSGGLHVLFLLPDHLGSSSIVVDKDTSELVERSSYQAYGAAENDYRPSRWDSFREDYRFTGKEDDAETGLQYFGKRFYAPNLGRWTSPDPLAVHSPLAADLNVYAYVSGRAFTWIDPTGLEADSPFEAPGRPGEQPFWFFLGHAAHWIIARDYKHARASMPNKVFTNTVPVKTILKESRIGDHTALTEREAAIRPDVTDTHDGVVGEIKPDTALGRQKGREQLAEQLAALNKTLKDTDQKFVAMQNYSGERVVAFAGGKYVWRLTWKTDNGVILYKWQRSKEKAGIIRVAQQAIAANEWVDPSSEDIQQDGPALAQFAGDKMVEADRLRAAAVITVGLQQAVGTAAMGFLNSGMNSPSRLRTVTPPGQTPVRQLPGVVPLRPAPANDNNVPLTRPAANGN